MMDAESKIRIAISSVLNGKGFDDATTATNKLKASTSSLHEPITTLQKHTDNLTSSFVNLKTVIATVVFSTVVKETIAAADSYKLIEGRLSLVTENTKELIEVQQSLFTVSQNTMQAYSDTAQLYTMITRSTQNLNKTQKENLAVTEAINKAIIISGASQESANAAIIQLGQGFASGTLRGDELNSVMEQTHRVAEAIAKGMGITVGELRSLGAEGKLTAEAVYNALLNQQNVLNKEFAKMPLIVGQSVTMVGTSLSVLTGKMDEATGATASLSAEIKSLSQYLDQNSTELIATWQFVYATGSRTIDVFNLVYETIENTTQRVVGYVNLTVYGSLEVILTMLTKVVEGLNVIGLASDKGLQKGYADLEAVHQLVLNANSMIAESYTDLDAAIVKLSPTIEDRIKEYNRLKKAAIDAKDSESDILKKDLPDRFTRTTAADDKYWEDLYSVYKSDYDKKVALEKKAVEDKKKLNEDYYDYIADLSKTSTQDKVDQEILTEAYKYQKFLDEHKLNLEQREALERAFTGAIERIQLDGQKESLKKQEDALLEYYKAIGNDVKAGELQLKRYKEELDKTDLTQSQKDQMYSVAQKDYDRTALQKQLEQNERYYEAIGDYALAAQMKIEKLRLELEKDNFSPNQIEKIIAAEEKAIAKTNAFSSIRLQSVTSASKALEIYKERAVANTLSYGEQIVTILDSVSNGMNNSFESFFDTQSDNFMKFENLAKNILNEIYMSIMRTAVIQPLTSSLISGVASVFTKYDGGIATGNGFTRFAGGYIAGGGYASYDSKANDTIPALISKGEAVIPASSVNANREIVSSLISNRGHKFATGYMQGVPSTSTQNIKVQIVNESGQDMKVSSSKQYFDGKEYIISVVIDAIDKNSYGLREIVRGAY